MVLTGIGASVTEAGALADVRRQYQSELLLGTDLLVVPWPPLLKRPLTCNNDQEETIEHDRG